MRPAASAAISVAALAGGFGGLLFELVALRRLGLAFGNTAATAAWGIALFLLGLGAGGLTAPRLAACRRRPRAWAAALYAAVAAGVLVADGWLRGDGIAGAGPALAGAALGVPALLMGAAFPLLFAGAARPGVLIAGNLLGSVAACLAGGGWAIPELGLAASAWLAGGAYALAAALALAAARVDRVGAAGPEPRPVAVGAAALWLAGASGAAVVGVETLALRRLPFFLEGFQPTLSGVLASCLLALAAGAAALTPWLRRLGRPAPAVALALAGLAACAGLLEHAAPALARTAVGGDLGFHLRILASALVAVGLPCALLGAVVPLCVHAVSTDDAVRARAAGALFCAQGVGSLIGALGIGHALPAWAPARLFALAPLAVGAFAVAAAAPWLARRVALGGVAALAAAALTGLAGAGTPFSPRPPVQGSRHDRPHAYRYLAHASDAGVTASVVYDRAHHSMVLFTDEFRAAYTGPGTSYMQVLGHLPLLLRPAARDVAVIAFGTGTTAEAVCAWPGPRGIDLVEISPAVLGMAEWFGGDGPLPAGRARAFLADPRVRVHVADGRRYLAARPPASLDVVTMEPLLPYAPGTAPLYSAELYAAARRALRPDGVFVQWLPTHAMPTVVFATLLRTFAQAFPRVAVYLVDQSTLLCGSAGPLATTPAALEERFEALPDAVRTTLHEAGIAAPLDLGAALVSRAPLEVLGAGDVLTDDRPFLERIGYWSGAERLSFYPRNLDLLAELARAAGPSFDVEGPAVVRLRGLAALARGVLVPGAAAEAAAALGRARTHAQDSVLLWREQLLALRWLHEREALRRLLAGDEGGARAAAERHLARDPASALLQACRGLAGGADDAGERAVAVEPTFFALAPTELQRFAPPAPHRGPLEDLAVLPAPGRLAVDCSRPTAAALALRAAFPVRCARALVEVAAARGLDAAEAAALREVLDPATVAALADAVVARGGTLPEEVGPLWRGDLAMPAAFARLLEGPARERAAFAELLGGRRGERAVAALAELLVDDDLEVRRAAAAALFRTAGESVPYDPRWDEVRRRGAADRLRALR